MKTEISTFCEDCLHILQPFPPALQNTAEDLANGSDKELLDPPLAALNDIRARLRSLVEKLANQHAYLLIFGPLKSGKSTLMNAVSGAYVSEVTSLPGYPCLVLFSTRSNRIFQRRATTDASRLSRKPPCFNRSLPTATSRSPSRCE